MYKTNNIINFLISIIVGVLILNFLWGVIASLTQTNPNLINDLILVAILSIIVLIFTNKGRIRL